MFHYDHSNYYLWVWTPNTSQDYNQFWPNLVITFREKLLDFLHLEYNRIRYDREILRIFLRINHPNFPDIFHFFFIKTLTTSPSQEIKTKTIVEMPYATALIFVYKLCNKRLFLDFLWKCLKVKNDNTLIKNLRQFIHRLLRSWILRIIVLVDT